MTTDPIVSGPWLPRSPSGVRAHENQDYRLFAWLKLQTDGAIDGVAASLAADGDYVRHFTERRGGVPSIADRVRDGGYTGVVLWLPRGRMKDRAYDLWQLEVTGRGLDKLTGERFAAGAAALCAVAPKVRTVIPYHGYIKAIPEWWLPEDNHRDPADFIAERANQASLWFQDLRSALPEDVQVVAVGDAYNNNPPNDINWRTMPDLYAQRGVDGGAEPTPGMLNPKLADPHWWHLFAQPEALKPIVGAAPRNQIKGPMLGWVVGDGRDTRPALVRAVDIGEQTGFAAVELHSGVTAIQWLNQVKRRAQARATTGVGG